MISDELYEQLKAWLIDATGDLPSRMVKNTGLCSYMVNVDLIEEMQAFWEEQGLYLLYPFNFGSHNYYQESNRGLCHLNPRRLAWVRERIAEYDHTLAMYEEEKRT